MIKYPSVSLIISNLNGKDYLRDCLKSIRNQDYKGTYEIIVVIEKTRNVRYLGYVENLEGWIKASSVCITPILRGGGTKLKVLEYAAAGKPIVATFKGVEGLEMVNSVHGLFYKGMSEDFVDGIRRLLKDDQRAEELGRNANKLAKMYDWTVIGKKLYETYLRLID